MRGGETLHHPRLILIAYLAKYSFYKGDFGKIISANDVSKLENIEGRTKS